MSIPRHRAIAQEVEDQLDYLEFGEGRSLSPIEKAQFFQGLISQFEEALNSVDFTQCKNPGKAEAVANQLRTTLNAISQGTWVIDEDSAIYELLVTDEFGHLIFG